MLVDNIFCPTGKGGGVDPTCSPKGKSGYEMTKTEYEKEVAGIEQKPNDYLKLGGVVVVQNPTSDDYRMIKQQVRERFPGLPRGEAATRFTQDKKGNRWIWAAHEGTHSMMEPLIEKAVGEKVNQNFEIPRHRSLVKEAIREGKKVPKRVQEEYPEYSDWFEA